MTTTTLIYALLGGILPALFWLWFWIQEDKLHPEPRSALMKTFIGGMLIVIPVYFIEKAIFQYFGAMDTSTIFLWAVVEEMAKYLVPAILVLHGSNYDEPIDALVYMITAALGFAALENTLFILNPLIDGQVMEGFITGNMRFIGASLLHVVCSAIAGYCIGRAFFSSYIWKGFARVIGLSLAIGLHTLFNMFIIYVNGDTKGIFIIFSCVWLVAIVVLLLFERIKKFGNKFGNKISLTN